ncbi:magnesium/cobalt transporter CorA [Ruminiclostridium herbifermentans]|uniref:Magnesium transport protein CorA n=1 Tax=Ruminiclostridium herbifermentans TaxID=2488810 RepID=A0A4U7JIZ1_9FIRM|nr:magnesium/cobalt transporter CorA [Ruminiclostridium herbifermentans]QNU65975.1 magnesium/cobalt transporter CorA [Ruminiclostridium herbifermentans]
MHKIIKSRSKNRGLPPGSLVYIGDKKRDKTLISLIEYDEEFFEQRELKLDDLSELDYNRKTVKWINVEGLYQIDILSRIGEVFDIHPLAMEDILNTDHRPKIEYYDKYMYISAKMLFYNSKDNEFNIEQISFILGSNYIISFSERDIDVFEPVIKRLQQGMIRERKLSADYLLYCLLDIIVDDYFNVLECISETIEAAEDDMINHTSDKTLITINKLKRQVLFMHKGVWPLRDVLSSLGRGDSHLIKEATEIYIRDLYEHVVQVMDTTETLRDILSGMMDVYLSSTSNRMNEIMKVLTIISTVFMPLSFIVGVYGMNIPNMPELSWRWMYPALWLVMLSIAGTMLYYFKKKKWW